MQWLLLAWIGGWATGLSACGQTAPLESVAAADGCAVRVLLGLPGPASRADLDAVLLAIGRETGTIIEATAAVSPVVYAAVVRAPGVAAACEQAIAALRLDPSIGSVEIDARRTRSLRATGSLL